METGTQEVCAPGRQAGGAGGDDGKRKKKKEKREKNQEAVDNQVVPMR